MSTTLASAAQECVLKDGSRYSGDFVDGKRHGTGANTFPNGVKYEGQWVNDEPHGLGVMTLPCGTKSRRNEWKFGKPSSLLLFEYQEFSFNASFSGPDMTEAVHFHMFAESYMSCMLQNCKPVGDGRYKTTDADEWYFKWSDLPNWEQIKATVAIEKVARLARDVFGNSLGLMLLYLISDDLSAFVTALDATQRTAFSSIAVTGPSTASFQDSARRETADAAQCDEALQLLLVPGIFQVLHFRTFVSHVTSCCTSDVGRSNSPSNGGRVQP
jgi:hypothetical protein